MDASQGPFVLPEVWTEISTQLDDAEMLLTLADISKTVRKGLAARPGMYLVATQEELDVALDAADARYIFLVRPGLTVHKNPADAQNAIVATRRGGMNVTGGELYLLGEDASVSASVSGGVAYAHGQASIVSVTGGNATAYGQATIVSVTGGFAYAHDQATIESVTGGNARAYDQATISSVSAGAAIATDDATIESVTGGTARAYSDAAIASLSGGIAHANAQARVTSVSGGTIEAGGDAMIDLLESQAGEAAWDADTGHVTLAGNVIVTGQGGGGIPDTVSVYGSVTGHIHGPR